VGRASADEPAAQPTDAADDPAEQPADQADEPAPDLRFAFSGEDGPDGCRYDGPASVARGQNLFTLTNTSDQHVVLVLFRFAEGYGYDDMIEDLGGDFPHEPEDANPALFPWLDGGWRPLTESPWGEETGLNATVPPGTYALACWVPGEGGKVGGSGPPPALTVEE
jgi:hypothetical protein